MNRVGIFTGADLRNQSLSFLQQHFGKSGSGYYSISRSEDLRPVDPNRIRKSSGSETTFKTDLTAEEAIENGVRSMADEVWEWCEQKQSFGRTVTVKIKFADFQQATRSRTLPILVTSKEVLRSASINLVRSIYPPRHGIRLLGVKEATGMSWLDAPVSGGTVGAAEGSLSIFVGGLEENLTLARPILERLGRNITRMGSLGAGQTIKLINQMIVSCSVAILSEARGLADRAGLNVAALPDALAGGRADSAALNAYWLRLADQDYRPLGTSSSMMKDIDLIRAAAERTGALLPLTSAVYECYRTLADSGSAGEDLTALARLFGQTSTPP